MTEEIELKLLLPDQGNEYDIISFLGNNGYTITVIGIQINRDSYLDTDSWQLLKHKLALRIRTVNSQRFLTLKSMGKITDGIAKRLELEIPISENNLSPLQISDITMNEKVTSVVDIDKLHTCVVIQTQRNKFFLSCPDGSTCELVFDRSTFYPAQHNEISKQNSVSYELEIEFLKGQTRNLDILARILTDTFHLKPSMSSKFEMAVHAIFVDVI
ncbi:CYTH domain-containing protein [bacterium]|nr:CYTH domain-containing protein [candidate division CSSED10-310 bacterium]